MSARANVVHHPSSCCIRYNPDGTKDYWAPSETGDWEADCSFGDKLGLKLVDYIQRTGDIMVAYAVVRTMIQKGHFGGVEAGHIMALLRHLI